MPVVAVCEKIHLIRRRAFKDDVRRHFAGVVSSFSGPLIRVDGYAFAFDPVTLGCDFRSGARTMVFSLFDGSVILNVVPTETRLHRLRYRHIDGRLVATDGRAVALGINEFNATS